ncbi:MAG TPA: ABC transporter substrate-binding protein [Candidatus Acidoferrum sp.]|nr:ABC transporter substrate-binding protein [Candidatus Acidoferrum sp.]
MKYLTYLLATMVCVFPWLDGRLIGMNPKSGILTEPKNLNRLTLGGLGPVAIAQQSTPAKIKLLTLLGRPLQLVAVEKLGIFSKFGLEVHSENSANSQELRDKLAAGTGDVAYLAVDNAVAMVDLAHQDVIIVMGGEGSQNELIAQPEIESVKDLRGKIAIVDAPNTAYALQLKKILLLSGLEAGRDYEIEPVGATPQRLVAMRENKSYAASMLGPPSSIIAKHEGFVSLGSVQESIGSYQAAGFFTERKWAQNHREALTNFLAAVIEAQRWLLTAANKNDVLALLTKEAHLTPEVAAETYESSVTKPGGFAKDAAFDLPGFQNVLKLRAEIEGSWGGHPPAPEKYYDASYYNEALTEIKGKP